MATTLSTIVEKAKTLGSTAVTAFKAIQEAESKAEAYTGEERKAYVIACVADELGDQITEVSTDLSDFIDSVVQFLNAYSWATKVIAVLTSILTILTYVPSVFGWFSDAIAKGAELYFEVKTGLSLDTESGEVTESTSESTDSTEA